MAAQGTPTPKADALLIASPGDWTLTLNPTAIASCLSQRRFTLPSSRIFDPTTFRDALTMIDADSFGFRDDVFRRIRGTNRFSGAFSFPDGSVTTAQFDLTSATRMRGQLVAGYRVDTTRCSETVRFVFEQQ